MDGPGLWFQGKREGDDGGIAALFYVVYKPKVNQDFIRVLIVKDTTGEPLRVVKLSEARQSAQEALNTNDVEGVLWKATEYHKFMAEEYAKEREPEGNFDCDCAICAW